jgi:hypothetical protein
LGCKIQLKACRQPSINTTFKSLISMDNSNDRLKQDLELSQESTSTSKDAFVNMTRQVYGEKYQDHLLEQYKIYVEMVDRISSRRSQMNNFYITLLSGLLAVINAFTNNQIKQFKDGHFQQVSVLAVSLLGLFLCVSWYANIQSYRKLSSSKFKVIFELERQLPFTCYENEWKLLKQDKRYQGYLTQTNLEEVLPIVLAVPYISLLLYSLVAF